MGKWNHRSRHHRRRSPERWYSGRQSSSSSVYCEDDGIPVWEKRFCEVIGSVPWQKVVEAKDFKSWYNGNVITWDDSACEDTFHNEKKRFWSQVNGLNCDVSIPDPDLYISEVDWDTFVDPELIRDLEKAYFAPPDDVNIGFKRGRGDKNWSGCDTVPEARMLETPWKNSDDIIETGKKSSGWNLTEGSSWEAKPCCVNEKANDTASGGCLTTEEWRENQWIAKDRVNDSWEYSGQGKDDGWDKSGHQNKKVKGSEEYKKIDNPWEAQPSCIKETAKDTTWGGCSGEGWEDRGWNNDSWGSGGWDNRDLGNQGMEMKEWRGKGYSRDFREPKGCNPWKGGFVPDNVAFRESGVNAGGWQTCRVSETKQINWDVKRASDGWGRQNDNAALREYGANAGDWQRRRGCEGNQRNWDAKRTGDGWGRQNKERVDSYGYHSNYKNSWPRRDDYQNRKVNFSTK
ncbi:hypothetical protein ISN45_At03g044590 [Arabidopsis thaliana x Arabidopsis arenosa]|uniref:Uncharacterized protein n=2 Tax=Arabidopsis TaxID=3701 RepID=A0A178VM14_ARATH|nr:hypothetical protein ISN45_At03g044590 [Arabidopsis thaliana x Arabidopsis arenosa]OAP06936.1 hypothetical protein AXX17_AT3G46330 [Arabidopsis thaliana]